VGYELDTNELELDVNWIDSDDTFNSIHCIKADLLRPSGRGCR